MRPAAYRILDEPQPRAGQRFVVAPLWPLLAVMLVGAWFGMAWFVLNGWLVGSPTRRRELAVVLLAFAGAAGLFAAIAAAADAGWIDPLGIRLAILAIVGWRLGCAYLITDWQERSVVLFEHFGGRRAQGVLVLAGAAFLIAPAVDKALHALPALVFVVLR